MQQTTKYQFKLIEGSDDFSPQPLNDNVEKVEELFQDMEEAVEEAQSAADAAQNTADAAYCPTNKPYVIGSYEGTLGNTNGSQTITLGFKPSFLIICGNATNGIGNSDSIAGYYAMSGGNAYSSVLTLTDTGFVVAQKTSILPLLTLSGRTYDYIAFL